MQFAVFKEDIGYDNCPIYIRNPKDNFFYMNGLPTYSFSSNDVLLTGDFLVFEKESQAMEVLTCQK